ncbi:uncharacterized protein GIQ15_00688 [Arthroderma uncinatum]|uniref:uncharacterized protein n=1 Tax=Arthroderma uncinatum TaxID=74035 RepID=UPI00144A7A4C|nr:uncharacterized protein GIQ15_00688 [Arthroderma uncinatum]KAF3491171.1 hypothetical protein GIQ15_00688 [Arthroderma uncinatum]
MPHSTYFEAHDPGFIHNDKNPLRVEFGRVANRRGWTKAKGNYQRQWKTCLIAELAYHVDNIVDGTGDKLENMQMLCREYCNEAPPSITACEKKLRKVHINLLDWIDAQRREATPHIFRTHNALKEYTQSTKKFIPKSVLKSVPVMKVFMRGLS